MKRFNLKLSDKEYERLLEIKDTMGFSSATATIQALINKRRIKPNIGADVNTLYHLAKSLIAQVRLIPNRAHTLEELEREMVWLDEKADAVEAVVDKYGTGADD